MLWNKVTPDIVNKQMLPLIWVFQTAPESLISVFVHWRYSATRGEDESDSREIL
jgi:hypothetical protein